MNYTQSMNSRRVRELIDAYGANPQNWPKLERDNAMKLLDDSSELQQDQQSQLLLDELLNIDAQTQVFSNAQASLITRKVCTMVAEENKRPGWMAVILQSISIPGFAFAMTVILATVLIITMPRQPDSQQRLAQAEFDRWVFNQVASVNIEDEAPAELGFMDLVELEIDAES